MSTRICNICNVEKPIEEFRLCRTKYRYKKCKKCTNTTYCKICNKKAGGKKKCARCYDEARGVVREFKCRKHSLESWLKMLLRSTKLSGKTRNRPVKENDLDFDLLLGLWEKQNGLCAITNMAMNTQSTDITSASVDRIDPLRGYLKGNVMLTCQWVNMGRNRTEMEKFKAILKTLDFSQF